MPSSFGPGVRAQAMFSGRRAVSPIMFWKQIGAVGFLCLATVLSIAVGSAQVSNDLPGATEDHVSRGAWWPTKKTNSSSAFAGERSCRNCHAQQFSTQANTPMANAAVRLRPHTPEPPRGEFQNGTYSYRFVATNPGFSLQAESGGQSISKKVLWTFGAGVHGQTYILGDAGQLYEAEISSFSTTRDLDLTPGHTKPLEGSLESALGTRLPPREAARCFACHSTDWSRNGELDLERAIPGVHCEACHGPGVDHIDAANKHLTDLARKTILNPAHLTPPASVDFCGSCHRTSMDVLLDVSVMGLSSIRFQPYRLQKSRCWEQTKDERLTCTACHDPHESLVKDARFYDQKCLSCHSARVDVPHRSGARQSVRTPAVCPKQRANCTDCHMPKYVLPEMHSQFTDHFIRVAGVGEEYPN